LCRSHAATINLGLHVGAGARIGNGATVKENVPAGTLSSRRIWPAPRVKPKNLPGNSVQRPESG
jgi:serine acetyltransferase